MPDVVQTIIDGVNDLRRRVGRLERLEYGYTNVGARVWKKAAFSHNSSGSFMAITFDEERFDTDGMHSTTTNTERLTVVTPGTYAISGHLTFAGNAVGYRQIAIRLGGSTYLAVHSTLSVGANDSTNLSIATVYNLAATEYVELCAWQDSGGTLAIAAGPAYSPEFAAARIA